MKRNITNRNVLIPVIYALIAVALMASSTDCSENRNDVRAVKQQQQNIGSSTVKSRTIAQTDTILKYKLNRLVLYRPLATKKIKSISVLKDEYGQEGAKLILALNRLDEKDFRKADTLIIPDTITSIFSYSPYPYVIEAARSVPKLILISRKIQAIAAYENGLLVRWGPTSTGRKAKPTPEGLFSMNWKSKKTTSTIDSSWVLPFYFNFNNKEGVALHQFDMPGYPASHACVRLLEQDAKWFFYWAEQWLLGPDGNFAAHGTPIIVFDEYDWGKRRPWRKLLENPGAAAVSQDEIDSLMNKYLPAIKDRIEKRKETIAEMERKKAENQTAESQTAETEITTTTVTSDQSINIRKTKN